MNQATAPQMSIPAEADRETRASPAGGCPLHGMLVPLTSGGVVARTLVIAYGLIAYAIFFVTFLYAIGFVTGLVVPKTVSSGQAAPLLLAMAINGSLLGAFALQHTIMSRGWFKRWITRIIPEAIERSTFVLASSLILAATFAFWQPMPDVLLQAPGPISSAVLTGISLLGFGIVLYSSFLINHFDLFGLRQVAAHFVGRRYHAVPFRLNSLYRVVRHPLMFGFLVAFWITPTLTVGHLFFALMTTGYILVGVAIEERDLIDSFGDEYREYKVRVRGLVPLPVLKRGSK
ncbi:MAG: methanethiol S-methyltransferase [Planctomycetota bacterium]